MKPPLHILVWAALCAVSLLPLPAEQPVVPVPAPAPPSPPPIQQPIQPRTSQVLQPRPPLIPLLSRNYLLRISVTEGDRVTEYKLVTAGSSISITTQGGTGGTPSASINGQIEESEEGHIGVALVVSLAIPEPAPVQPGVTTQPGDPFQPGRSQRQSESFSASLRAKLGVEYPLFATTARTYRLTLTPHEGSTR